MVDPSDYSTLLDALKGGKDDLDFRKRLAWKAYQHTATYDSTVAEWMWSQIGAALKLWPMLSILTACVGADFDSWLLASERYASGACAPLRVVQDVATDIFLPKVRSAQTVLWT